MSSAAFKKAVDEELRSVVRMPSPNLFGGMRGGGGSGVAMLGGGPPRAPATGDERESDVPRASTGGKKGGRWWSEMTEEEKENDSDVEYNDLREGRGSVGDQRGGEEDEVE